MGAGSWGAVVTTDMNPRPEAKQSGHSRTVLVGMMEVATVRHSLESKELL